MSRLVLHSGLGRELERALAERAPELAAELSAIRRRNAARLDVRALLSELDLPVEGRLSEEIRDTVFEAMGSAVGVEVAATPEAQAQAQVQAQAQGEVDAEASARAGGRPEAPALDPAPGRSPCTPW